MKSRNERAAITGVITPKREDVLSGRGPSCAKHNATTLWWSLVQKEAHKYRGCTSRHAKTILVKTICNKVHKVGGRFLEKRDGSSPDSVWDEVEVGAMHLKTSQALRDIRPVDVAEPLAATETLVVTTVGDTLPDRNADFVSVPKHNCSTSKHTTTAIDSSGTCVGAVNSGLLAKEAATEIGASQIDFSWDGKSVLRLEKNHAFNDVS